MDEDRIELFRKPDVRRAGASRRTDLRRQRSHIRPDPQRTGLAALHLSFEDDIRRLFFIIDAPLRPRLRVVLYNDGDRPFADSFLVVTAQTGQRILERLPCCFFLGFFLLRNDFFAACFRNSSSLLNKRRRCSSWCPPSVWETPSASTR